MARLYGQVYSNVRAQRTTSRPSAVIFDIDGTLANVDSLMHYLVPPDPFPKGWWKDFNGFHRDSPTVPVHDWVRDAAVAAHEAGHAVIIVTARGAQHRHPTAWFLALNDIPSDALYMRPEGDTRYAPEVKRDILERIRTRWDVIHAWDDHQGVLEMFTQEGIPVTEVPRDGGSQ